jgi:hypothetical protein
MKEYALNTTGLTEAQVDAAHKKFTAEDDVLTQIRAYLAGDADAAAGLALLPAAALEIGRLRGEIVMAQITPDEYLNLSGSLRLSRNQMEAAIDPQIVLDQHGENMGHSFAYEAAMEVQRKGWRVQFGKVR